MKKQLLTIFLVIAGIMLVQQGHAYPYIVNNNLTPIVSTTGCELDAAGNALINNGYFSVAGSRERSSKSLVYEVLELHTPGNGSGIEEKTNTFSLSEIYSRLMLAGATPANALVFGFGLNELGDMNINSPILEETLGIILFQEQVIQVATAIADLTPGEADSLRRAMTRKRPEKAMDEMRQSFLEGAKRNGVDNDKASRIFQALEGFAEYGFCKSHAAGFALLCYQSAWLKRYYQVEFYCALLNNQPMGFYSPEVIVRDAKRHGIEVLPADINKSSDRCNIEDGKTCPERSRRIRLGFRYIKGYDLSDEHLNRIIRAFQGAC